MDYPGIRSDMDDIVIVNSKLQKDHDKCNCAVLNSFSLLPLLWSGYHHSLPSSPYAFTAGPDGQRLPPSGTLSSEYLNQGNSKVLLLICNTAGSGSQAVR